MRHLQALCVARHRFLAEHFARFFNEVGVDSTSAVGLDGAIASAWASPPDVVVCEYDLLATFPLHTWERDEILSRTPVVAVSLTRHPDEMHPLDINGIAGFLYLPLLRSADAHRMLHAAATQAAKQQDATSQADVIASASPHTLPSSLTAQDSTSTETLGAP